MVSNSRSIGIVSWPGDLHARAVAERLKQRFDARAQIIDLSRFPEANRLRARLDQKCAESGWSVVLGELDLSDLACVWWRRPMPYQINPQIVDPKIRDFTYRECQMALGGILRSLSCGWVNPLSAQSEAEYKPRQIVYARRLGLRVPETLITNDPFQVIDFHRLLNGRVLYKVFRAPIDRPVETRLLNAEAMNDLSSLVHAPAIFQEAIDGNDVRVIVFKTNVHSVEVKSSAGEFPYDARYDQTVPHVPHELPSNLRQAIVALVRSLGLVYGAIDLRLSTTGEYYFIEINPAGQFLYLELLAGLPLADEMAKLLFETSTEAAPAV